MASAHRVVGFEKPNSRCHRFGLCLPPSDVLPVSSSELPRAVDYRPRRPLSAGILRARKKQLGPPDFHPDGGGYVAAAARSSVAAHILHLHGGRGFIEALSFRDA